MNLNHRATKTKAAPRRRGTLLAAALALGAAVLIGPAAPARAAATGPLALITNGNQVSVLDTGTDTITGTILDEGVPQAIVVSPDGTTAYTADFATGDVSVIDIASETVTATISLNPPGNTGAGPIAIAISPDGSTVYVADDYRNVSIGYDNQTVYAISTATDTITAAISLGTAGTQGLTVSPDGSTLYVADFIGAVSVIDTATDTVTDTIAVPGGVNSNGIALSRDGSTLYIANTSYGTVSVMCTVVSLACPVAYSLIGQIPVGSYPFAVAVNPANGQVYVTNTISSTVSVIDPATDAVVNTIPVGQSPFGVAFNASGTEAIVADYWGNGDFFFGNNSVTLIDTATGTVTDTVDAISNPYAVAFVQPLPTSTTLAVSPANPVAPGTSVTLTATESPAVAGNVQFYDGGSALGSPVAVSGGTAAYTTSALTLGSHSITAAFTPSGAMLSASTSAPATVQVSPSFAIDQTINATGTGAVTTAPLTTTGPRLLVAYVSSDGPATAQSATVTGAGLTWSLVVRANTKGTGTAEIWTAQATGPLTGATVTSTPKTSGYDQSLTVVAYTGATGVGASATAGAKKGAPTVSLTTTEPGSWVFAVGEDYSHATARTVGTGQSLINQWVDTAPGETFWAQDQKATTPTLGTTVTMSDTAPTSDVWNLAAVEILP